MENQEATKPGSKRSRSGDLLRLCFVPWVCVGPGDCRRSNQGIPAITESSRESAHAGMPLERSKRPHKRIYPVYVTTDTYLEFSSNSAPLSAFLKACNDIDSACRNGNHVLSTNQIAIVHRFRGKRACPPGLWTSLAGAGGRARTCA